LDICPPLLISHPHPSHKAWQWASLSL
jgi:hypothetical protein